ncbi:MAG TPA: hypothetical protein VGQ97_10445 [Xanthobacteraceae bacterium]|jgi:hypothetical protein|nr:hypothetical protein [Xanthobacteraceae bacterium]
MAHLIGLLIFVVLIAAQVAAVVAVHRNERAREREIAHRPGPLQAA